MKTRATKLPAMFLYLVCATTVVCHAADDLQQKIKSIVDIAVQPVMARYGIPGMSIGITLAGKPYIFSYGVASIENHQPVTPDSLFEIGSITKTMTATLASYAQVTGHLSLTDTTGEYLRGLQGTRFGSITLLNLGTHTSGGLPLQVPDGIKNDDQLMQYFKDWRPTYPPGTYRTYSNVSSGTLGIIAARSMGQDFAPLMEQRLFPMLGMKNSYFNIPAAKLADYAEGYTKENVPIRMSAGVLSSEAYGLKTTVPDMVRFIEANMDLIRLDKKLQLAITKTHTGYFRAGPMTQDLIWEQYPYPVALKTLLEGNSSSMIMNATVVAAIYPPQPPREDVWINKTGSTNGFGAYVAFVPEKRLGIVILANKNYPNDDRVTAAYKIVTALADREAATSK